MKKLNHFIISLILSFCLIIDSSLAACYAYDESTSLLSPDTNVTFIISHFSDFDIGDNTGSLYLTDSFDVYLFDESTIASNCSTYFLIDIGLNEMIGQFVVYEDNSICFYNIEGTVLDELYINHQPFAYGMNKEGFVSVVSSGEYVGPEDFTLDDSSTIIEKRALPTYAIESVYGINSTNSDYDGIFAQSEITGISLVRNKKIDGEYRCWAAVIAMKANKESKDYSNLTTQDVYDICKAAGIGVNGNESNVEQLISRMFHGKYKKVSGTPTFANIYNWICQGKTIYARFLDTSYPELGHVVLVSGILVTYQRVQLTIYDPNNAYTKPTTPYTYSHYVDNPTKIMKQSVYMHYKYMRDTGPSYYNEWSYSFY